jgi:phospholipid transport system substrate-binding protein
VFAKFRSFVATTLLLPLLAGAGAALAAGPTPEALIRQVSTEVLEVARTDKAIQAGDVAKISALVESKVMPHVDFEVITRSAVGVQWRGATADQRSKLQAEFKLLLIRVYAGALTQLKDQAVEITRTQAVSGSTAAQWAADFEGRLTRALATHCDACAVFLGGNDAFAAIGPLLEILARTEAYVRTRLPEVAAIPTPRNVP